MVSIVTDQQTDIPDRAVHTVHAVSGGLRGIVCARITPALDIVRRVEQGPLSGYHELGIVKHRIDLWDEITVRSASAMAITCDMPGVPCDETNVCWKAARVLSEATNVREAVAIDLRKKIPAQGGLAGGSADAAAVMSLLNRLWKTRLSPADLASLSRGVGMDVPYYFLGGTAFDTETGDLPIGVDSRLTLHLVVYLPPFGVSTKDAYGSIDYTQIGRSRDQTQCMREAFVAGDLEAVAGAMHNDFEWSVFRREPRLRQIKRQLLDLGCIGAVMTGSGSSMIGLARDRVSAVEIARTMGERALACSSFHDTSE